MRDKTMKRRDFQKLTMAAFGGMLAGTGCTQTVDEGGGETGGQSANGNQEGTEVVVDAALLLQEPHVCRGLNTCEGKGNGKENACAGQGTCAAVAEHACDGQNACKGQGGCGGYPGQNTCEGKGHCAVPLSEETWAIARKQLEHLMKDAGKEIGQAPAA